jgi:hypothetical protein
MQRFTLVDFLPNWDISRGFLSVYIIYNAGGISAAIRELYCTFADFFYKTGIFLCTTTTGRQEYDRMTDRGTDRGP